MRVRVKDAILDLIRAIHTPLIEALQSAFEQGTNHPTVEQIDNSNERLCNTICDMKSAYHLQQCYEPMGFVLS